MVAVYVQRPNSVITLTSVVETAHHPTMVYNSVFIKSSNVMTLI
jgi:hypothetical protein